MLQPYLDNIQEVGDEVYFMCRGKIYKLSLPNEDIQEADFEDLK